MFSSDNNGGCFLICFVATIFIVSNVLSFACGKEGECDRWELIVVERGVAEWYADPKTGIRELKWKCGEVPHEADRGD